MNNYHVVMICDTCKNKEMKKIKIDYIYRMRSYCSLHKKMVSDWDYCDNWELIKQETTFTESIGSEEVIL